METEGLNKEVLGDFFGENKEKNQEILKSFCELLDFTKLEFAQALRLLLSRFKLPGEAQQIDRIVKIFSSTYRRDNPEVFNDEDTPYILSYSTIMLHTNLHSVKIQNKDKMTKEQFVIQNKCACPHLDRGMLERIYDDIAKEKFAMKADCKIYLSFLN